MPCRSVVSCRSVADSLFRPHPEQRARASREPKLQLENLVDFEKCCKTHIFLQKSEPIQPKTSNIRPRRRRARGEAGPGARRRAPRPVLRVRGRGLLPSHHGTPEARRRKPNFGRSFLGCIKADACNSLFALQCL